VNLVGFADEHNEIDLLILSLMLRRMAIPVSYLGNDLDPQLLGPASATMIGMMLVFYTDLEKNALLLNDFHPQPNDQGAMIHIAYAGHAMVTLAPRADGLTIHYLGSDLRQVVESVLRQMQTAA
jgi:hypothetical protein